MPRTVTEEVGGFELRLTYDDGGRLVGAVHDTMRLELLPDVPSGKRSGVDGSEQWRNGKVNGSWVDSPYGHDCDVGESVSYDDWVENGLRILREQVFFAYCPKGKPPTPKLAAVALCYAIEHGVLSPSSIHPAAIAATRLAVAAASPSEVHAWRGYFEREGLEAYAKALDEGLGASPAQKRKRR